MRGSQPPRIATWLLSRMTSSPTRESLAGDLMERFHDGRSRSWYWRQVFTSILADTANEFRRHPLLAVRASAIGCFVLVLLQQFIQRWMRNHSFHGALWVDGRWIHSAQWLPMLVWYLWLPLAGVFTGWLVERLHPRQRFAMTRVFAGCFVAWQVVQLCLWIGTIGLSVGLDLRNYALSSVILFVTILVGGLWGSTAEGKFQITPPSVPAGDA